MVVSIKIGLFLSLSEKPTIKLAKLTFYALYDSFDTFAFSVANKI